MNIGDYKFEDYVSAKKEMDIHPSISDVNTRIHNVNRRPNLVYYGPDGVGKYSCALDYIARHSPSGLGYEKRMTVETSKGEIIIKISDVHFEIDVGLLGCNAKQIWNDVIKHIYDVLSLRKDRKAFILCKNFQDIHSELLDIFYSYIQTTNRHMKVSYVILTNSTSFIPRDILKRCIMVGVPRPSKQSATSFNTTIKPANIVMTNNLRKWKDNILGTQQDLIVKDIVNAITSIQPSKTGFDFITLRDRIYDINVMGQNPCAVAWSVLSILLAENKIPESKASEVTDETTKFLELFSNNYRPIYHLERYVYFLATIVNEL
jgi:hypothetical protein